MTFNRLPKEILVSLGNYLDLNTQNAFNLINQRTHLFFHSIYEENNLMNFLQKKAWDKIERIRPISALSALTRQRLTHALVNFVCVGDQDKAEMLLRIHPNLCLLSAPFTDISGRIFDCSALEYALWGLDKHMWGMMLSLLPRQEELYQSLILIAHTIEQGLEYQFNGKPFKESHFSFQALFNAYQAYKDNFQDFDAIQGLRMEQDKLPVAARNELCRPDRTFSPLPSFEEEKIPRSLSFRNHKTKALEQWTLDNTKTRHYFIIRAKSFEAASPAGLGRMARGLEDFLAFEQLYALRKKELFITLESLKTNDQKIKIEYKT